MSNYTQTNNFTALTTAQAVINGAAFDTEYGNISTAIASKIDSTSTGESVGNLNFTSPTLPVNGLYLSAANSLSVSCNTTKVATFKTGLIIGAPTGGDQGAGTINAVAYYVNGVAAVPLSFNTKIKATTTSRATNTTLSNDPDLVFAIPGAGTYQIQVRGFCTYTVANGLSVNLNYSGTFTAANSSANFLVPNSVGIGAGSGTISAAVATLQYSFTGNSTGSLYIDATLVATGAGTIGFSWAQTSSSGTAVSINAGSVMTITRIA